MSSDSILDAAFSGFRLVRERPRVLAYWTAVQIAFGLTVGIFFVWSAGPTVTRMLEASSQATPDPSATFAALGRIAPIYLVVLGAGAANYAAFQAAANRALWRPEESRFGYLRFGADELRQLGLIACLALAGIGVYVAVVVVAVVIIGVTAAAMGAAVGHPSPGAAAAITSFLITFLVAILAVAAMVFFWVRLSLASAITFSTRRINVFGSWSLTRGRFWSILGVEALVLVFIIGITIVGYVLIFAITGMIGGGMATANLFKPNIGSISAYFSPVNLITVVLKIALSTLILPVSLCPVVDIYRRITGPSDVATVFS